MVASLVDALVLFLLTKVTSCSTSSSLEPMSILSFPFLFFIIAFEDEGLCVFSIIDDSSLVFTFLVIGCVLGNSIIGKGDFSHLKEKVLTLVSLVSMSSSCTKLSTLKMGRL